MNLPILIKKNNTLTDGNIPDRLVLSNKLVNALYSQYELYGEKFSIKMPDLLRLLGLNPTSGSNKVKLKQAIKTLQQPIELRDFEYKGNGIEWLSAPFLNRAIITKAKTNEITFMLDDMLIQALKQKKHYTEIDLTVSNKFKTKYGIVIWEMYLRYKNQPRAGVPKEITYQTFSIEELNKKFGSNYKTKSEIKRCIDRGLKEIKKITDKDIAVKWQNDLKEFGFFWKKEIPKPKFKTDRHEFINHIRKNYVNDFLLDINLDGVEISIAVNPQGLLYDMTRTITKIEAKRSKKIWEYLFNNQNKITVLGQTKMSF